jgi:Domain of unknown function (DUF932)
MLNTTYQRQLEEYGFVPANHDAPVWFDVKDRPIYVEGPDGAYTALADKKAVMRMDTGQVLGVHSKDYTTIDNDQAFGAFHTALYQSHLDLTDAYVGKDMAQHGARAFLQYVLPAYKRRIGDACVSPRICLFNSYDGSTRFRARGGLYSFVCANQSIIGEDWESIELKHVGEIDLGEIAGRIVAAFEKMLGQSRELDRWPQIAVSDAQALGVFKAVPAVSRRTVDFLAHRYLEARNDTGANGGPNLWAAYNVLTHWSTFGIEGENAAVTKAQREVAVWKATRSQAFQALLAA